jgi:hypothetical protein
MARTTSITVPPALTDSLIGDVSRLEGVVGVQLYPGAALHPPGDVIVVQMTTEAVHALMQLLDRRGIGRSPEHTISTAQPDSLIAAAAATAIARESSDATWEEMQQTLAFESNMNASALAMMALAGVIGAVGLATNALHLVIAATIIAPGFEPISRMALGVVATGRGWAGAIDFGKGYAALIAGGAATALLLRALGTPVLFPTDAYYASVETMMRYWISFSATSLVASTAAGLAGAFLVVSHRSMLTAGVLVALALIPTAVAVGVDLAAGEVRLAAVAFARFLTDVALVFVGSVAVFAWHRATIQRRRALV